MNFFTKPVSNWKRLSLLLTFVALGIFFVIFLVTGFTALYWAWIRDNLEPALSFLPWARNSGALAILSAAVALGMLFSSKAFPVSPKVRLWLSLLATLTIAFFAEFRNEGKFHFKSLVHLFGPGTWIHDGVNRIIPSLGDFVYRVEYSHWNDFLMGPAIVSVLFAVVFMKVYGDFRNRGSVSLNSSDFDSTDSDHALGFARILMNVGLFWFFIQAWAEKAGYLRNPHSSDPIDLPFEFAGTMIGFWMARVLTKPFDEGSEKFRSTFLIDFLASGVFGLLYTLVVGPLTENVASEVGRGLYPVVPGALQVHEYTALQQHVRPFELLLLASVLWWSLNRISRKEEITTLDSPSEHPQSDSRWDALKTLGIALGVTTGYLAILATMLAILEPDGIGWTIASVGAAIGVGTAALLLLRRAARQGYTTVFARNTLKD